MKKIIIAVVVLVIVGVLGWFFFLRGSTETVTPQGPGATTTPPVTGQPATPEDGPVTVIGESKAGVDIKAYSFGNGDTQLLFVGGLHGGYAPNTTLVAYELVDYLTANPDKVPAGVRVSVVPVVNPDGLKETVGSTERFAASDIPTGDRTSGRFNGNDVDLNRNFDCDWQSTGMWQTTRVSAGTSAFSEPETAALRDYITKIKPDGVVVWYSAAGGVYASNCHTGILPGTTDLMNTFAKASGYAAHEVFDYYETTGDMTNWLAKIGVPAVSVLLTNYTDTEWAKNKAGIDAVLASYAN